MSQTTQVRQTRHAGHSWKIDRLIKDIRSYELLHMDTPVLANQLCEYIRDSLEDLLGAMYERDGWQERVKGIYTIIVIIICLYTAIWYQVFLSNTNNLNTIM